MMKFRHSGKLGDILYSLGFVKELLQYNSQSQCTMFLQSGVPQSGGIRLTEAGIQYIKPLLQYQPYIDKVLPDGTGDQFDLDKFRYVHNDLIAGDIRAWYYSLSPKHLPHKMWEPSIIAPCNDTYKDKICISKSSQYPSPYVDINILKPYSTDMVFLGLQHEHSNFCKSYFPIQYKKVQNALQAAAIINGCKLFIGNQSSMFAIAQGLKAPRLMLGAQPHNVHPVGGWCQDICNTQRLLWSVQSRLYTP